MSVSTVSKVLNGRTDVAPETRERLAGLLRLHGYQVAPRLGIGVVDLLIADLDGPWAEELMRGTVAAAGDRDQRHRQQRASPQEFARWLKIATARGTLGALSVLHLPDAGTLRRLADARLPLVVIDPPDEPGDDVRSVGTTNWQGGMTATRHLIELGHRRIAAIGGPAGLWSCRARLDGYRSALRAGPAWTTTWSAATSFSARRAGAGRRTLRWPTRRPRSWPATTPRRSACCRPSPSAGCAPRTTSA